MIQAPPHSCFRISKFFSQRAKQATHHFDNLAHVFKHSTTIGRKIEDQDYDNGYRDGVITVLIPADDLRASYGPITEDIQLRSYYQSRVEGEAPRLITRGIPLTKDAARATHCQVVLYANHVLLEDEKDPEEILQLTSEESPQWSVVTLNLGAGDRPAPIHYDTLLHNHFHTDGGTKTNMSSEEFENALHASFMYWKDHVFYEVPK